MRIPLQLLAIHCVLLPGAFAPYWDHGVRHFSQRPSQQFATRRYPSRGPPPRRVNEWHHHEHYYPGHQPTRPSYGPSYDRPLQKVPKSRKARWLFGGWRTGAAKDIYDAGKLSRDADLLGYKASRRAYKAEKKDREAYQKWEKAVNKAGTGWMRPSHTVWL